MIKRLTQWQVRDGLDREAALRHWRGEHAALVLKVPGVRRYVQNHRLLSVDGVEPPYTGLGEVWFDSRESIEAALSPSAWSSVIEDAATFMDMRSISAAWAEEHEFVAPTVHVGASRWRSSRRPCLV